MGVGGGGWLEKLGIRLSQLPTKMKLKLKLKLSLAIWKSAQSYHLKTFIIAKLFGSIFESFTINNLRDLQKNH